MRRFALCLFGGKSRNPRHVGSLMGRSLGLLIISVLSFFLFCCSSSEEKNKEPDDNPPSCEQYAAPDYLGPISNENLTEISGLAISMKNPGVLWMHNDAGHGPTVYAVNLERETLGRLILDGHEQIDWEDIAVGPCDQGECLFVGDIGDNESTRDSIRIIVFKEPEVDPGEAFGNILITDYEVREFSFLDKPHDCEGLAVHPDGTVYVFTKESGKANMFRAPDSSESEIPQMEYIGVFTMTDKVTAADIHRNGRRLLLRTLDRIYEWRLVPGGSFEQIAQADRTVVQSGLDDQGEAVGYDPATGHIYHASETVEEPFSKLYRISCQ